MSKRIYSKKSEKLADHAYDAFRAGRWLELHEIRLLEEKLRQDHSDVLTRCTLLGYYSEEAHEQPSEAWCTHAEWVIKNCPDEKLVWVLLGVPDNVTDEQYEHLKECFLEKVKRNPKNANVAGNAARFCGRRDSKLAEKLYKKAKKLAPNDERWSLRLCQMCVRNARMQKETKVTAVAFKQGLKFVRKFENFAHRIEIYDLLRMLFDLAIDLDELDMAKKLFKKIKRTDLSKEWPEETHYKACRLAIKEGRIKRAKSQLLKFGKAGPCPDRFDLAQQILEAGEVETVRDYLGIVLDKIPESQRDRAKYVSKWIKQLNDGQTVELVFPKRQIQHN